MNDKNDKYKSQRKYMAKSRENLNLNLPIGTKDKWRTIASERGMSVTEYITKLIEADNPTFYNKTST